MVFEQKNIEAHYDQIFRFCARRLPTTQDAQDATQEVFLRLVRADATYADLGKPLAYLYRIARNVCADFHRRAKPADVELEVDVVDPSSSAGEEHLAIADAISRLDEEEQLVLELRYDQDLPVMQIAEVLGISRFSVRRIEKRALANLEKELGGEGHERGARN